MPSLIGILVNLAASESGAILTDALVKNLQMPLGRNIILAHSGNYDGQTTIQLLVGVVRFTIESHLGTNFERLVLSLLNNIAFTKIGVRTSPKQKEF